MKNVKTIFSGIQPSGHLHIGNYLGAISQWVDMQKDYQCIFCVVDYHAITVPQEPQVLRAKIKELVKIYVASGINPNKSIIFLQSDIKEHTELAWVLNCVSARIADLRKMTQFKDKSEVKGENVSVGLFDYPVLMAADILLYNTDIVPVGDDQVQHVELCRDLARRFNTTFGETFKIPQVVIRKEGARIMGLDDPNKKMSKSAESEANYIALTDDIEKAKKKIMRAVTDSGSEVKYDKVKKPAIANLLTIYSLLSGKSIKDLEKKYHKKGYGDFKKDLAEVVENFLHDFQKRYNKISDKDVEKILEKGAKKARVLAAEMMEKVKEAVGI
jgi:tryptophanyl-tRNA synthetase